MISATAHDISHLHWQSCDLKRKNEMNEALPCKRIHLENGNTRWGKVRDKIKQLFLGCNRNDKCSPLRMIYWKEFFPVRFGEMVIHQYPRNQYELEWRSLKGQSYVQFIKNKMLREKSDLSENNVIYFNQDELIDFIPSFHEGFMLKKGMNFKPKRYIFVYNRSGDFFVAQKFKTLVGRIQHSSLSGGLPVKGAGWLTFDEKGHLTEISNFSGHYWISIQQVNQVIDFLKEKNVNLGLLRIVFSVDGTPQKYSHYTLDQWEIMVNSVLT